MGSAQIAGLDQNRILATGVVIPGETMSESNNKDPARKPIRTFPVVVPPRRDLKELDQSLQSSSMLFRFDLPMRNLSFSRKLAISGSELITARWNDS